MFAKIIAEKNPREPQAIRDIRLFAVIGTWMEADVIASTIMNAYTQGCERVYLVDNDSADETSKIAIELGATIARVYSTKKYDEITRLREMNEVMYDVSLAEKDQSIWWLFLDADEFPHGPWGLTILDYLRSLDRKFRVVGSRFFNHYPSGAPSYIPSRHPLDLQPLCEELDVPMCSQRHRKHSLLRFDKDGAPIKADRGFHLVICRDDLLEPQQPVFLHHFPFREERATRAKLTSLLVAQPHDHSRADGLSDTAGHMLARLKSLDAVYRQDWENVVNFLTFDPMYAELDKPAALGISLRRWDELVGAEHPEPRRWY